MDRKIRKKKKHAYKNSALKERYLLVVEINPVVTLRITIFPF